MNGYEKIIMTIRNESQRTEMKSPFKIGIMTSENSCKIGTITLDKDDLYFAEHLLKPTLTELDFEIKSSGGESHTHTWKDKSEYLKPLKKGDKVLIVPVGKEKYMILDKIKEVE